MVRGTPGSIVPLTPSNAPVILSETEPNGTFLTANALSGTQAWYQGAISPVADADWFSFGALAGDRVYAATQTGFALTTGSQDSVLDIFASNGTTVLENDDENGAINGSSSAIGGTIIPTNGTYYIRVTEAGNNGLMQPYYLHFRLQRGSPTVEVEPNNADTTATPLAASGWMTGTITASDIDVFRVNLNAGESVYIGLDMAPVTRTGTGWNGRTGLGLFTNQGGQSYFVVNDTATARPNAEAYFYTVRTAGTFYVYVDAGTTGATGPYHLNVSRYPALAQTCTTYISTNVPLPLGPALNTITNSTLSIPSTTPIQDINVTINITQTWMPDMDVQLVAPNATTVDLFTDVGVGSGTLVDTFNATLDDQSARPVLTGLDMVNAIFQPEPNGRLSNFNGLNPSGTWTLRLTDDEDGDAGNLLGWSIELCSAPLAVTLNYFEAQCRPQDIQLAWETASETDVLGFNLYRATDPDSSGTQINGELIPSQSPGGGQGASYTYDDATVSEGTYYYWLEVVDMSGATQRFGPANASYPCAPTAITMESIGAGQTGATWLPFALALGITLGVVGYGLLRHRKASRS